MFSLKFLFVCTISFFRPIPRGGWSGEGWELCSTVFSVYTILNPFTLEFTKWTLQSPNLITSIVANRGFSKKINDRIATGVELDETYKSHLDLHCLQRYLFWSAGMKELIVAEYVCLRINFLSFRINHTRPQNINLFCCLAMSTISNKR